jgi:hypothetical protein
MTALHIRRRLDSETLPELKPLIGRTVEVIVLAETEGAEQPLRTPAQLHAELAASCAAEGRGPVENLHAMLGKWPGDKEDGFEEWVREQRQNSPVREATP